MWNPSRWFDFSSPVRLLASSVLQSLLAPSQSWLSAIVHQALDLRQASGRGPSRWGSSDMQSENTFLSVVNAFGADVVDVIGEGFIVGVVNFVTV